MSLMVRIKDLEIPELEKYLKAYKIQYELEPDNDEAEFRIRAIEKALTERELLGIETKPDKTSFFQRNVINKIKKQD